MDTLNRILKTQAIQHGLCREWTEEWDRDNSMDELIDKFKRGLDFCIQHDYPDNAFIIDCFPTDVLRKHHVYVNDNYQLDNSPSDTYVVQGDSHIVLDFGGYSVGTIWLRHHSELNIMVHGHAKLFVHVYDEAELSIEQSGSAKVYVYKHSKNCGTFYNGNVLEKCNF